MRMCVSFAFHSGWINRNQILYYVNLSLERFWQGQIINKSTSFCNMYPTATLFTPAHIHCRIGLQNGIMSIPKHFILKFFLYLLRQSFLKQINLTWGDYWNSLLGKKLSENLKVLPGIEPGYPWIQGCDTCQYATGHPFECNFLFLSPMSPKKRFIPWGSTNEPIFYFIVSQSGHPSLSIGQLIRSLGHNSAYGILDFRLAFPTNKLNSKLIRYYKCSTTCPFSFKISKLHSLKEIQN